MTNNSLCIKLDARSTECSTSDQELKRRRMIGCCRAAQLSYWVIQYSYHGIITLWPQAPHKRIPISHAQSIREIFPSFMHTKLPCAGNLGSSWPKFIALSNKASETNTNDLWKSPIAKVTRTLLASRHDWSTDLIQANLQRENLYLAVEISYHKLCPNR